MYKLCFLFVLLQFVYFYGFTQTCNCLDNLNTAVTKVEANYAGFPSKTIGQPQVAYQNLLTNLREQAQGINEVPACYALLANYVRFFRDKHFSVSRWKNRAKEWVIRPSISETSFKDQLSKRKLHPLEGIWVHPDSTLTLGIQRSSPQSFEAIVLASKSAELPIGLVYYQIRPGDSKGFLVETHDVQGSNKSYARQRGNLFQHWSFALWGKVYPQSMNASEQAELATWRKNNHGLAFQQLSPHTTYLKIPTFTNNDDKIQALVSTHDAQIRRSENLIIDLRGNGGGNTGWSALLPYVMTNTIVQGNSWLRVSPDNVKLKLEEMAPVVNNPVPEELKKYFTDAHMASLKKAYAELPTSTAVFYPIHGLDIPLDSILIYPKKVALLVDEWCGSSTEYFLFLMRQSKKVQSYGSNTVGVMDYEGPTVTTPLPSDQFILTIPISRSSWTEKAPIDLTGFTPDVKLNMPQEKWVDKVKKLLEK